MAPESFRNPEGSDTSVIDIQVIFDIYGEEGEEIIQYALSAFLTEASRYVTQIYSAITESDFFESNRLFHSLKTMAGMIGAAPFVSICAEMESMTLGTEEFDSKYLEFNTVWQRLLNELVRRIEP